MTRGNNGVLTRSGNGRMCAAGCVTENDKNNVSYFAVWLPIYKMCVFVYSRVKFSPITVLTVSVSPRPKNKTFGKSFGKFFFLILFFPSVAIVPIFLGIFDHPELRGNQLNT